MISVINLYQSTVLHELLRQRRNSWLAKVVKEADTLINDDIMRDETGGGWAMTSPSLMFIDSRRRGLRGVRSLRFFSIAFFFVDMGPFRHHPGGSRLHCVGVGILAGL